MSHEFEEKRTELSLLQTPAETVETLSNVLKEIVSDESDTLYASTLKSFLREQQNVKKTWITRYLLSILANSIMALIGISIARALKLDMGFTVAILCAFLTPTVMKLSEAQKKRSKFLLGFEKPELAGCFCDMLQLKDSETVKNARVALTKILPMLEEGDTHLLSLEQRKHLRTSLTFRYENKRSLAAVRFQLAVLKAYEKIGTEDELATVTEIARSKRSYSEKVKTAALECLPYLQQKSVYRKEREELLRPSSGMEFPQKDLLRPASGVGSEPEDELLRPSTSTDSGKTERT